MSDLTTMLGMGVAIQLRNAFSVPAAAVIASSRNLTNSLVKDAAQANNGWKMIAAGGGLMFLGTTLLGGIMKLGHEALMTSSKFDLLKLQISNLAKSDRIGGALFQEAKQFTLNAPFQIDQVTTSIKSLMAYGINAKDVMSELATAGNWASMMTMPGGLEKAAEIIGRIKAGSLSYAMRSARTFGITSRDIAKFDPTLITPKNTITPGADPDKFLVAFNKAVEAKFGGGMKTYMSTVPGMLTNLKDQWIMTMAGIGDEIRPVFQQALGRLLNILNPRLIAPFAKAVGEALGMLLRYSLAILVPIGHVVVWIMELAKERPGLFKLGFGLMALVGVLLNLAGVTLVVMGAWRLLSFVMGASYIAEITSMFTALLGPLAWVALGAVVFYQAWSRNLLGIRDMLIGYWGVMRLVFQGVWSLMLTLHNGVGTMTVDMANKLKKAGLFDIVVLLFMWAFRVRSVLIGIAEGFQGFLVFLGYIMAGIIRIFQPVFELARVIFDVAIGLLGLDDRISPDKWRRLGEVVGFVGSAYLLLRAISIGTTVAMAIGNIIAYGVTAGMWALNTAMYAARVAAIAFRGAMWLLSLAMDANPVGIVILAIAALIAVVGLAIYKHKELGEWFHKTWLDVPAGVRATTVAVGNFLFSWTDHWNNIKNVVQNIITWFKTEWETVLNWLSTKLETVMKFLQTPATTLLQDLWTDMKQPIKAPDTHLSAAQAELLAHPVASFSELLNQNRAATQAAEATTAAVQAHGQQPIQVHSTIKLDNKKVGQAVTTHQMALATGGK